MIAPVELSLNVTANGGSPVVGDPVKLADGGCSEMIVKLALTVALPVTPRVAGAQTAADSARATQLKKQGDDLVHSLHYREALAAYDDSAATSLASRSGIGADRTRHTLAW